MSCSWVLTPLPFKDRPSYVWLCVNMDYLCECLSAGVNVSVCVSVRTNRCMKVDVCVDV